MLLLAPGSIRAPCTSGCIAHGAMVHAVGDADALVGVVEGSSARLWHCVCGGRTAFCTVQEPRGSWG
jgi:hypothetical protein